MNLINNNIEITLNEKQKKAVNSKEEKMVIIAPAGSGKTSVLVESIKVYMEEHPLDKVVAITFTRKAAEELSQRLGYAPNVSVSTIHSWALRELEDLSIRISKTDPTKSFKVRLLEEPKIKEILSDIAKKRRYYYVNIDIMYSYVMGNYQMDISDAMRQIFNTTLNEYKEFKLRHGLYDFTDLPEYLLDKLNDYGMDLTHIDALFVDEFQDVDDIQVELFERVLAKKKLFIGDPKQSIYQFRGATEDVVRSLQGYKLYDLDVNYRSNQEIIDFATTYETKARVSPITFSGQLESYKSAIFCERGNGGTVYTLARTGAAYKVNEYLKEKGEKIVKDFLELNPMILCRKNKEVREIRDLGWERVQTIHQAKGLEYNAVIVTDFEIKNLEDVNISYVGMTRARSHLMAANYDAFIKILRKLSSEGTLNNRETLF